jgi:transcriptional regulator with XRE-family HTH domain
MLSFMKQGRPTTKPRTDFGQRLADARERAGLTQQQLADKLRTSQRALARWERDPVALRPDQLFILADALGVSLDHLIGRADPRQATAKGPPGKLRLAFERAHKLPRHEQNQIVKFVEAYVSQYASKAS